MGSNPKKVNGGGRESDLNSLLSSKISLITVRLTNGVDFSTSYHASAHPGNYTWHASAHPGNYTWHASAHPGNYIHVARLGPSGNDPSRLVP